MDRDLVEKFIEVTGENETSAAQYLALADGNLETAISLLFEAGGSTPAEQRATEDEPEVRAPILPTQEVLVPAEVACSFPRASNSIFDRFRDFAVETRRQEEELTQRAAGPARKISQRNKSRRLEDLFRPPCDILFLGTFNEARERAKSINRWLLVNIQDQQEFACQILNRDVWPNQQIREIIKDHFVLWQVLSHSTDGKRYIDFYKVLCYPYLAIIDPRTGECMRSYNHVTVDSLVSGLNDMLSSHASPENIAHDSSALLKKPIRSDSPFGDSSTSNSPSNSNHSSNSKRTRAMEKSEDGESSTSTSYMETKASTSVTSTTNHVSNIVSKRSRIDELDSKDQQIQKESEQEIPIDSDAPTLRLCLRLPNGSKQNISMLATDTIASFLKKMCDMGFDSREHTYLIPFPKTNIGELSTKLHLSETILYPANTVFITKI